MSSAKPQASYQDFVFLQNADGSWKPGVLSLVGCQSVDEFSAKQVSEDVKKQEAIILLTLAGAKGLMNNYPDKKAEWKLVVQKGVNFIKVKLAATIPEVMDLINATVVA
jgi:hypothetical protein